MLLQGLDAQGSQAQQEMQRQGSQSCKASRHFQVVPVCLKGKRNMMEKVQARSEAALSIGDHHDELSQEQAPLRELPSCQNQEKGDKTPGDEAGRSGGNGQDNYIN